MALDRSSGVEDMISFGSPGPDRRASVAVGVGCELGGSTRQAHRSGLALATELDLPIVLRRIVELAVELTNATYGALGVLGSSGSIEEFITVGVTNQERTAIGDPPVGHGVLGLLIRETKPIRLPRIGDHPDSYGFPANHPPMTSFLGAPVMAHSKVFGNIYLTDKRDAAEFDVDDEEALVVLAVQAGTAIENVSLHRANERLALLEDRERIAKELHDGVIQALFAVGMGLEGTSMVATDPQVAERINVAVEELDHVIRDLRNYIFGLRPGILADRELDTALRAVGEEFQAKTGVVTIVEIDPRSRRGWHRSPPMSCNSPAKRCPTLGDTHARRPAASRCATRPASLCWRSTTMAPGSSRPRSASARVSPTSRGEPRTSAGRRR